MTSVSEPRVISLLVLSASLSLNAFCVRTKRYSSMPYCLPILSILLCSESQQSYPLCHAVTLSASLSLLMPSELFLLKNIIMSSSLFLLFAYFALMIYDFFVLTRETALSACRKEAEFTRGKKPCKSR